jgi:hypothetical protein
MVQNLYIINSEEYILYSQKFCWLGVKEKLQLTNSEGSRMFTMRQHQLIITNFQSQPITWRYGRRNHPCGHLEYVRHTKSLRQ